MDKKKFLLVPVLICAFSLVLFIFQINGRTVLHFSTLQHTFLTKFITHISATPKKLNVSTPYSILKTSTGKPNKFVTVTQKTSTGKPNKFVTVTMVYNQSKQSLIFSKQTTIPTKSNISSTTTSHVTTSTMSSTKLTPIQVTTSTISSTKTTPNHVTTSTVTSTKTTPVHVARSRGHTVLCPTFMGGFGNMLFQFASTFGIAMSKNMSVVVNKNNDVNRAFNLNVDVRTDTGICRTLPSRTARWDCAFDNNIVNFNNTQSFQIGHYLQSWKYFYRYRNELRKQLTFRQNIQKIAHNYINNIVKRSNYSSKWEVTLVGVHVRRGDMVGHSYGYNVATPEYISKSVQYFLSKYKNVIFVVSTQDIKWTKLYMPKNAVVKYVSHPRREILVATLASCDHTITTVGSFGWWIGWLTGGEVTYFKWPVKEGTALRYHYSKDFSDFFYPGWIGM